MKQWLVCSDNHGNQAVLQTLQEHYPNLDAYIHCGDSELGPEALEGFVTVRGNTDFEPYPMTRIVDVGDVKIFVTHGQTLPSANRMATLAQLAQEHGCQMACTGHTHIYEEGVIAGVTCLNPGSLAYNRDGRPPSYALVTYDAGHFSIERYEVSDL